MGALCGNEKGAEFCFSLILRTQPNVTIKAIGSEMRVIQAFGPEITGGSPITPEDVLSSEIKTGPKGRPYYVYDLKVWHPIPGLPACSFRRPTRSVQKAPNAECWSANSRRSAHITCGCRWRRRAICWWWRQCCETAHI